jgi:ribosomal protein S18 acetylase RimI-like enzyme
VPFVSDDTDAVVSFCVAHGAAYDADLLRRLLLELTSEPAGVFVIRGAEGIALVATVVDRVTNGADAANLETLGVRAPLAAESFRRLVIEPAVAFARAGERRALQVALQPSLMPADGADQALRDAGFAHAYATYEMRRNRSAPDQPIEPLPEGWSWAALDELRVDAAHAALLEIFHDALATSLPPLADFRRAVVSGEADWRVLLDGQRIAGLLRILWHEAPGEPRRGEVRIIGRMPTYRGRGLGPRLLREALRLLGRDGAIDIDLVVEAKNAEALALYRRFGFEPTSQTPVFALTLR